MKRVIKNVDTQKYLQVILEETGDTKLMVVHETLDLELASKCSDHHRAIEIILALYNLGIYKSSVALITETLNKPEML